MGMVWALRRALDKFLQTTALLKLEQPPLPPPIPSLAPLRAAGVPVVDEEEFRVQIANLAKRRGALAALLDAESWSWDTVWGEAAELAD